MVPFPHARERQAAAVRRLASEDRRDDGGGPPLVVYVVGAGASHSISPVFPLGSKLASDFERDAEALLGVYGDAVSKGEGHASAARHALSSVGFSGLSELDVKVDPEAAVEFAEAVRAHSPNGDMSSIDGVLTSPELSPRARNAGRRAVGMTINAATAKHFWSFYGRVMPNSRTHSEGKPVTEQDGWDWLRPVAERVTEDLSSDRPRWRHAFVTFNYDRNIEYYLWNYLNETLGQDDERVATGDVFAECPVVHVHGEVYGRYYDRPGDPYPGDEYYDIIHEGIKFVGEPSDDSAVTGASGLIAAADRIVFLGFGYDPRNLERIAPPEGERPIKAEVVGTAYGEPDGRGAIVSSIKRLLGASGRIELGGPYEGCFELLRGRDVWAPPGR